LTHVEGFGQALLSKLAGLPEIAKGHLSGYELCAAGFDLLAARCAEFPPIFIERCSRGYSFFSLIRAK
jgi:hypothetical protein